MVRATNIVQLDYGEDPVKFYEFSGLKNDSKPTDGVATGSLFTEVDTGDVYAYDEAGETWHKICALMG